MHPLIALLAAILAVTVVIVLAVTVLVPLVRLIGKAIAHVFRFIGGEIGDALRIIGGVITSLVFIPLVLANVVIGRWSASAHFGRALQRELASIGHCFYRMAIGHPARLLGLRALTEGIEQRIPAAIAHAPTSDRPSKRTGQFDGYKIVGSIKSGGSGAKLYIAEPDETKRAVFARLGRDDVDQVVIKSFSLRDGSSLPQMMRENRALEAAKQIGLVLEHDQNEQRFYYVMPYIPGDPLGAVVERMHAASGAEGLSASRLREGLAFVEDLLETLHRFHAGGLWHKDVKPDNIIVSRGEAHLVDLGLVTQMTSAMTLTTHGTEYFRDPELVRMALRGAKVHEVDGARFDLFAAGAVLYSIIENSFPAHGALSQVTKRCPETVKWVIRRSMTDYNRRYRSAQAMLADVRAILEAEDLFAVKPKDLPSMGSGEEAPAIEEPAPVEVGEVRAGATPVGAGREDFADPHALDDEFKEFEAFERGRDRARHPIRRRRGKPTLRILNWWTGSHALESGRRAPARRAHAPARPGGARAANVSAAPAARVRPTAHGGRPSAKEQLASAQERARAARERARARLGGRDRFESGPNAGVLFAALFFLAFIGVLGASLIDAGREESGSAVSAHAPSGSKDRDGGEAFDSEADAWLSQFINEGTRQNLEKAVGALDELRLKMEAISEREDVEELKLRGMLLAEDGLEQAYSAMSRHEDARRWWAEWREARGERSEAVLAAPAPPGAPGSAGSVFVVDRVLETAGDPVLRRVRSRLGWLRALGFRLEGLGSDEEDIALTASLLKSVGAGRPSDPKTRDRMQSWLAGAGDGADAILWIELDDSGEEAIWHVIPRESFDAAPLKDALERG